MRTRAMCAFALGVCGAALAQTPPVGDANRQPTRPSTNPATPGPEDARAKRERMLRAAELPREAQECRRKGVTDADMKESLRAARRKGLKADEMADITTEQRKAIDEHGPVDNFGAFVQAKLDEGLRGRDLAAAIRAEHAKRGKGKGYKAGDAGAGPGDDGTVRGKGKGKADDADKGRGGPPETGKGKGKGKGGG